jgi:valyl-tRNA synthetase
MTAPWPVAGKLDQAAEADAEWLKSIISAIRSARTELNLAPGKHMPLLIQEGDKADHERLGRFNDLVKRLARLESIEAVDNDRDSADCTRDAALGSLHSADAENRDPAAGCAVSLSGNMRLLIPLAGVVDVAEEMARLGKQLEREQKGLQIVQNKLANERFVANAPEAVVAKERQRLAEHRNTVDELTAQIDKLKNL